MPKHIIIDILNSAFNEILKETHDGAMAYVNFLPNEELYKLFNPPYFSIIEKLPESINRIPAPVLSFCVHYCSEYHLCPD